uniref:YCII-related domain-containing protein n=1 Tax=Streptomyces sp. CNT-179 TaxID=1338663 RepID=S4WCN7_9ACTN|nr:hypothetical protein [Streptomyces sp. CNT-179]
MPKYLLIKHYRGGPEPHRPVPSMDQWSPEDAEAHTTFLYRFPELLEENGEFVELQALLPTRTWVRYDGPDADPVTTDDVDSESGEQVAGWCMVDVKSYERALEIAALLSSNPGPGGEPLHEWIEVREVLNSMTSDT